jgi:hypothetical protein
LILKHFSIRCLPGFRRIPKSSAEPPCDRRASKPQRVKTTAAVAMA